MKNTFEVVEATKDLAHLTSRQKSTLTRLRLIGWTEGVSFLLLLFIAVPIKHLGNDDTLVRVLGPIHGGLFLLYILAALLAAISLRWHWKLALIGLAASVVPFGPFFFEAWLRRQSRGPSA